MSGIVSADLKIMKNIKSYKPAKNTMIGEKCKGTREDFPSFLMFVGIWQHNNVQCNNQA